MPAPTTYSEALLADYQVSALGDLAAVLGWDAGSSQVLEAVNDALLDYGASDIASITGSDNLRKLRALGRVAIWRAVAGATAGFYSFTDVAQQKFDRDKVHKQAVEMLEVAQSEARALGADPTYSVSILSVRRTDDPYAVLPDEERVIA